MPLLLLALLPPLSAQDPGELLAEARAAERSGDVDAEQALCVALLEGAPDSPEAQRCAARLDWMAERQDADGSLRSLAAFLAARRAPPEQAEPQVRALLETSGLPPALEAELRSWLAGRALAQGQAERALSEADLALALTPELPAARRQRAQALGALGRWEEAEATEAQGPTRSARPREGVQLQRAQVRDRWLRALSWLALLAFVLPAAPLAKAGWSRRGGLEPAGLVPLSVAVLGAALLAGAWTLDTGLAIAACLPALAALHLLSAGAGVALQRPWARALLGLGAAGASLGAGFLILGQLGALEGVLP
ncbi:MAG: hypothetical protein H6741_11815 [Alphaproteobacteria bacterium]|nr:hypothetical protein [Alphaproteobacteria bacterium]MCB9793398.1 hypothetical protein [Alphaproteobacteria bacterium]